MVNLGQSTENILVAGHRGICALYPENTMVSFRAALEADVDNIEMDLNVTRDGRLVVIHDTTLDRTTDKTGKVRDYTSTKSSPATQAESSIKNSKEKEYLLSRSFFSLSRPRAFRLT